MQKRQIEKIHEQALADDPNVFLYDEVYDDIQDKRNQVKQMKKTEEARKPKYINKLLETAEKRKKDYERRIERQVQKDLAAEGEQFKDKETFVTTAYRKKLEEMKQAEKLEKREEYLERIGDVTKQPDISGFYRHIYSQKVTDEKILAETNTENNIIPQIKPKEHKMKKNFRKRENSYEKSDSEGKILKTEHLVSNLDQDSDFSVSSSSDEEDDKKVQPDIFKQTNLIPEKNQFTENPKETVEEKLQIQEGADQELEIKPKEIKVKIDIWAKRTVGDTFLEAVKRYYERKAMRESLKG